MPNVHPTAVIDDRVELADDVTIGPWCHVSGAVRLGPGTRLLHRVTLEGPLVVGERNIFYPNSAVGYAPQDRGYDPDHPGPGVVMGDRNVIREGVTIHRATGDRPTTVGDDNYFMANSHIGHDSTLANFCTLANGTLIAGHVEVQDRVVCGGNSAVHQFCRIGRMTILSGVIGVTQDVPPFMACFNMRRVGGLNLVGLRRGGLRKHIRHLKRAFDLLYRSRHSMPRAVELMEAELDDPLVGELVAFVRASKRGICPYEHVDEVGRV